LSGEQYAGETRNKPKDAEKAAAMQALQAHAADIEALPPPPSAAVQREQRLQRKVDRNVKNTKEDINANNPALTSKVKLNTLYMKISQRYLKKGETCYNTNQVLGGFQATVQLWSLPDDWSARVWAGEVCSTKQKAEQSAASIALEHIESDDQLMAIAEQSRSDFDGQGGKAMGKGKSGKGTAWDYWMWSANEAWSRSGPDLPREKLESVGSVLGAVVEWKDKFGWIQPHEEIKHTSAKWTAEKRGGKVYVSMTDLKGCTSLASGQAVRFQVYVDEQGLGAEEVEVV
jgi:cold shock CspA family protein